MTDTPQPIPDEIMEMSLDQLIREHRRIEDFVKLQADAFKEWRKPHDTRQQHIETRLLNELVKMNAGKPEGKRASISTEHGTAYLSTIVTPRIKDGEKEKYLDWVLDNYEKFGAMLQIGAPQKDALNDYTDQHGQLPPHVETTSFTRVNIRRA